MRPFGQCVNLLSPTVGLAPLSRPWPSRPSQLNLGPTSIISLNHHQLCSIGTSRIISQMVPRAKGSSDKKVLRPISSKWSNKASHKIFLENLARSHGFKSGDLNSFYKITARIISDQGGSSLLNFHYRGSVYAMLSSIYPDHTWHPWLFAKTAKSYWNDKGNHKKFVDYLGVQLGIREGHMEDWYKISTKAIVENGGGGLLYEHYSNSLSKLLGDLYPNHFWQPWKFTQVSRDFWNSKSNQKLFMDSVGKELGISKGNLEGWYNVSNETLIARGGKALLANIYNGSKSDLLASIYPEHKWVLWKFRTLPRGSWESSENQRAYLAEIGRKLGFKEGDLEAWYGVSTKKMVDLGARSLLYGYHDGSLLRMLSAAYPDHPWKPWKFSKQAKHPGNADGITEAFQVAREKDSEESVSESLSKLKQN